MRCCTGSATACWRCRWRLWRSGADAASPRDSGSAAATLSDLVARAALIAILFALTLVPGAALHEAADRLTHAHTTLAIHSHAPVAQATQTTVLDGAAVTNFVVHGLGDGFAGQAIALPLMVLAMWEVRKRVWMSGQREG